jgi:hypothetical protein
MSLPQSAGQGEGGRWGKPPCPNMRKPPYAWRLMTEASPVDKVCRSSCFRLNLLGRIVLEADGRDEVQLCL